MATNTRFSQDALQYGRCVGLELLGWNSPEGNGIEALAERHRLFPVTILDLRKSDQDILLDNHFILVNDVLDRAKDVRRLLSKESAESVMAQANEVLAC